MILANGCNISVPTTSTLYPPYTIQYFFFTIVFEQINASFENERDFFLKTI